MRTKLKSIIIKYFRNLKQLGTTCMYVFWSTIVKTWMDKNIQFLPILGFLSHHVISKVIKITSYLTHLKNNGNMWLDIRVTWDWNEYLRLVLFSL